MQRDENDSMQVTILGSGASEGIPAFLCECSVCANARRRRGKEVRQNSFAMLTASSGESLLIDLPPHFKMSLDHRRFSSASLCGILVTHRHDDHSLGLPYLWDARIENQQRTELPLPAYMPQDVFDLRVRPVLPASGSDSPAEAHRAVEARIAHPFREFVVGPFSVTPLETNHLGGDDCSAESDTGPCAQDFGYLIEDSDGKRMAYVVDASAMLPPATSHHLRASPLDCLVYECTFAECAPAQGHCDIKGLRRVAREASPRRMIATHIGHGNLSHRALARALRPAGIEVAFDGMRVKI
jgi:phosphoribosyl 1,2-cyclic phosphate phosphodiesterase